MSKVQMMTAEQGRRLRPPRPTPPPPPPPAPLWRWTRQSNVPARRCWRPWWLLGLVEIVTYPQPAADRAMFVRGIAASCGLPARPAMLMLMAARP